MALDFKHASLVEGVRFTAQVGVPNVVQGLFRKREVVVSSLGKLPGDHLAYRLVEGLEKKYGPDPFWVRVGGDEALLVTHPDDLKVVLGGSPSPFASDPDAKRKGMAAFQPDALTISRGDLWADRRAFAEAVLETGNPTHTLARGFAVQSVAAADGLMSLGRAATFDDVNKAFQRLTRIVVFGAEAADDASLTEQLGDLMSAGNKMPGKPADGYADFHARIKEYVDNPDPAALTGLIAGAPQSAGTDVPGQLIHWLFAMGDTLPANLMRALAVLATHSKVLGVARSEVAGKDLTDVETVAGSTYLAGCILEAMRLWPTTALFGRVQAEEVRWANGQKTPAGTQVLIHNLFNHRNRARVPYADRFSPEEWVSGDASDDWRFNFFSHGPQGCPGAGLSIFLGQAFLGRLIARGEPKLAAGPRLRPEQLPYAIDIYGVEIRL
ncbi:cytochrome P450 [Nocardioides humilatus]|uniref:Cytochrome P450 n=1 Tax=Nocardioides humilatus TaxID=2607660 RepID=A0A5B1LEX9_9ACTN|nr:cytochrome P450 [Nocardioides humilatus]KAA1419281.1 cytochrome P450 [Nocardioides humilatus]